jgi:hypothetical protein
LWHGRPPPVPGAAFMTALEREAGRFAYDAFYYYSITVCCSGLIRLLWQFPTRSDMNFGV